VAGTGVGGYSGDGGQAKAARLFYPRGIAVDAWGNLYIADSLNFRVRKVTTAGIISTIAGTGVNGSSGATGLATQMQVGMVQGVAADFQGNVFFTDTSNHNVRKVALIGIMTSVAGGDYGYAGDGGRATSAQFRYPRGLATDGSGNLFVADCYNHRVRKIAPDGTVTTVAGTGTEGYSGDRGPAASAQLGAPYDLAYDPGGAILIADLRNYRVRKAAVAAAAVPFIFSGGIVNAASYQSGAVAAGEIVAIYGARIGPSSPATGHVGASGRLDTTVAETRVLFDGVAAPLIMVSAGQTNAVVPYAVAGKSSTSVQFEYKGVKSAAMSITVAASMPGLFAVDASGKGQGAILNQDYTVNSPSNPASKGSVVMIYATGEGQTNPPGVDGKLASVPLPAPVLPVIVGINNAGVELQYAGAAPGMVAGALQVNARVPVNAPAGNAVPVSVKVGNAYSQSGLTMAIR
jgi:uncharacterized protein (TIGR03437 family)